MEIIFKLDCHLLDLIVPQISLFRLLISIFADAWNWNNFVDKIFKFFV